ncbi:ribosome biogenesis protein BRX1 [Nematocida homosporus]|uniref:ribosome biogenesis protein BRX1 n=1 Tax=Nematocida homosporus TaxID=1912981 RepID=UPI00221E94DD|nr:ribosome biogenesis protein BRX1 [Nematocida homosporus]KAI5185736.1 ribosome biogenesis protein BRX1 [Nematocida homosporus]
MDTSNANITQHRNNKDSAKINLIKLDQKPRRTLMLLSLKCPMMCKFLLKDLEGLMPENVTKDAKLKERFTLEEVAEVADIRDADNVFLLETRKKSPAPILWAVTIDKDNSSQVEGEISKPKYDTMKFMVTGIYSMKELKFSGNPLANSQMLTLFSKDFECSAGMQRAKSILTKIFNTTRPVEGEPSTPKDYVDKIASFFLKGDQIMVRFYHIAKKTKETERLMAERQKQELIEQKKANAEGVGAQAEIEAEEAAEVEDPNIKLDEEMIPWYEIIEVGPRFTLHPRESDLCDKKENAEPVTATTEADTTPAQDQVESTQE